MFVAACSLLADITTHVFSTLWYDMASRALRVVGVRDQTLGVASDDRGPERSLQAEQGRIHPVRWRRTCLVLSSDFDRDDVDCPADTSAATYFRDFSGPRAKTTSG